jgi:prolyl 4-hydroxylase
VGTQAATPELRQWIIDQAQAGHSADAVLRAMLASGWQEDAAIAEMEATMRGHLVHRTQVQELPPAVVVPEPDLEGSPLYQDAGDRRVHVLSALRQPRIVVFGNLLSAGECEALVAQSRPRMVRSRTVTPATGGEEVHSDRRSDGMFFARGESPLITRIEARIARLLRWPVEHGEGLQILRYGPGAEYRPHHDYFEPDAPGTPALLQRGGQRVGTLVIYLSEPARGGGTVFPDVGLEVAPKRGNAVFFSYERPHPGTRTLHGGAPVIEGEKWIATKWLRERPYV